VVPGRAQQYQPPHMVGLPCPRPLGAVDQHQQPTQAVAHNTQVVRVSGKAAAATAAAGDNRGGSSTCTPGRMFFSAAPAGRGAVSRLRMHGGKLPWKVLSLLLFFVLRQLRPACCCCCCCFQICYGGYGGQELLLCWQPLLLHLLLLLLLLVLPRPAGPPLPPDKGSCPVDCITSCQVWPRVLGAVVNWTCGPVSAPAGLLSSLTLILHVILLLALAILCALLLVVSLLSWVLVVISLLPLLLQLSLLQYARTSLLLHVDMPLTGPAGVAPARRRILASCCLGPAAAAFAALALPASVLHDWEQQWHEHAAGQLPHCSMPLPVTRPQKWIYGQHRSHLHFRCWCGSLDDECAAAAAAATW